MHGVCVCIQSDVVSHAECALALPLLSTTCAPIGVQPLMAIDIVGMTLLCAHMLTFNPNTG